MKNKFKLFLVLGLVYVADIIYKLTGCITCDGDYFGLKVPAAVDFMLKIFFAFVLLNAVYKERQKTKIRE